MIPDLSVLVRAGLGPVIHEPLHGKSLDDRDKTGHDDVKN
jgi:hypothetical protein